MASLPNRVDIHSQAYRRQQKNARFYTKVKSSKTLKRNLLKKGYHVRLLPKEQALQWAKVFEDVVRKHHRTKQQELFEPVFLGQGIMDDKRLQSITGDVNIFLPEVDAEFYQMLPTKFKRDMKLEGTVSVIETACFFERREPSVTTS
eukprot:NODE_1382_length_883_cov_75.462963_g1336_i0.p1 GENE.NODE_1382_length_883_cov_75.462963_g1336_i0~~NODE_1382_length_883_cov_75.462963_g1336_i0.p1  ORF type:complete len:147 (+),score=28.84 NODE_1382_length_883_cov_75.462963_g1336_i0:83-523(+)